MSTNSSSKRNEFNSGSDSGSNLPTASEAHRSTARTPQPSPNAGQLESGYVGGVDHNPADSSKSAIRNR